MHKPDEGRGQYKEMTDAELTALFETLRVSDEVSPRAGFYGRVMDRIEVQQRSSIWSVFLEPVFSKRLVFASVTFLLLMGVFLATSTPEPEEQFAFEAGAPVWSTDEMQAAPALGGVPAGDALRASPVSLMDAEHGRDAVFADIITYQEH